MVARKDEKSTTISWRANITEQKLLYYVIKITSGDDITSYNFTIPMITSNGMIHSVNVR